MTKTQLYTCIIYLLVTGIAMGQRSIPDPDAYFNNIPKSDLLILGTFHFKDAGLDGYKPQFDIDILSEEKQRELQEVIEALQRYNPTKIAVEARKGSQARIDSLYQAYLAGNMDDMANEIFQIGFRLAKVLGHDRVYAVDAPARGFDPDTPEDTLTAKDAYFTKRLGPEKVARDEAISETFMTMYSEDDKRKTEVSLLDYLVYLNSPERLRIGHGHYLIGGFKMNDKDDYYGADGSMWWYSRNIRIFSNLLDLNDPGKDRVFLLIGAGHVPIIKFLADASPDFDNKSFKEIVYDKKP